MMIEGFVYHFMWVRLPEMYIQDVENITEIMRKRTLNHSCSNTSKTSTTEPRQTSKPVSNTDLKTVHLDKLQREVQSGGVTRLY